MTDGYTTSVWFPGDTSAVSEHGESVFPNPVPLSSIDARAPTSQSLIALGPMALRVVPEQSGGFGSPGQRLALDMNDTTLMRNIGIHEIDCCIYPCAAVRSDAGADDASGL